MEVLRVSQFLYNLNQAWPEVPPVVSISELDHLRLTISRLARKRGNFGLAMRMLASTTLQGPHLAYEQAKYDMANGNASQAVAAMMHIALAVPSSVR